MSKIQLNFHFNNRSYSLDSNKTKLIRFYMIRKNKIELLISCRSLSFVDFKEKEIGKFASQVKVSYSRLLTYYLEQLGAVSGARNHSGKKLKFEISSNLSQLKPRLASLSIDLLFPLEVTVLH